MKSYYNTTSLFGEELNQAEAATQTQEEIVLTLFRRHPEPKTAPEVHILSGLHKAPEVSIRRALTNLKNKGYLLLVKSVRRAGKYKAKNQCYALAEYSEVELKTAQ